MIFSLLKQIVRGVQNTNVVRQTEQQKNSETIILQIETTTPPENNNKGYIFIIGIILFLVAIKILRK